MDSSGGKNRWIGKLWREAASRRLEPRFMALQLLIFLFAAWGLSTLFWWAQARL